MAELADATLLIVGLGTIGTEMARLAKVFGMRVIAVNRTGRTTRRTWTRPVPRIVTLFMENLRRYLAGDELISRVHPPCSTDPVGQGGTMKRASARRADHGEQA